MPEKVDTPDTFNCLANNVVPVTVVMPEKVDTPDTLSCVRDPVPPLTLVDTPETFA